MKLIIKLGLSSLFNRKLTTLLTVGSIALSVALIIGVEKIRIGAKESFTNTISKTDLIVGARTGNIQLLLYSVFQIGQATNNLSYKTFLKYSTHPSVEWAVPISLGDSHKGFRVIATNENYFNFYKYRKSQKLKLTNGVWFQKKLDVVLGAEVARKLSYSLGSKLILSHGLVEGIIRHEENLFNVVGILTPTGTPVDQSLFISLEDMEYLHLVEKKSAQVQIEQITAFYLGLKNKIDILRLQREINNEKDEALLAIIPGVTLSQLWNTISYAELSLSLVSWFVFAVGLIGMMISLYSVLEQRRREMSILRALGLGLSQILCLILFEAWLIILAGIFLGLAQVALAVFMFKNQIETILGLSLDLMNLNPNEILILVFVFIFGTLASVLPIVKTYLNTLQDGLSPRL